MIENPNGDFKNDIQKAKASYKSFPTSIKNDIKSAAMANMSASSVIYLVRVYGL